MQKEFKSEALEAIYEIMQALRDVGAIDEEVLRRFDAACVLNQSGSNANDSEETES